MVELNREFLVKINGNRLQELTHIDASYKRLIKINSNVFQGLTKIEKLNLRNNKISEINGGLFESLSSLKELYLSNNKLKIIESDTFKGLDKLETLTLSENELKKLDSNAFENCINLKVLNLNNNKLKRINGQCFKPFKSIEVLELYENDENFLSFFTSSTAVDEWKYDKDKLKEYGFMSDWKQFLEFFSQLGMFKYIYFFIPSNYIMQILIKKIQVMKKMIDLETDTLEKSSIIDMMLRNYSEEVVLEVYILLMT